MTKNSVVLISLYLVVSDQTPLSVDRFIMNKRTA